jgi:hypothetical protein
MLQHPSRPSRRRFIGYTAGLVGAAAGFAGGVALFGGKSPKASPTRYQRREWSEMNGFTLIASKIDPATPGDSLEAIRKAWSETGPRHRATMEHSLLDPKLSGGQKITGLLMKALVQTYDAQADEAYETLQEARSTAESDQGLAEKWLFTIIFYQGLNGLRLGENENCLLCRGASSCILPIAPAAVHTKPRGSQLAVKHFSEYLEQFPDDLEAKWLLNLAQMTLGNYPANGDSRFVLSLDRYFHSDLDIGRFRDIAHLAGVDRFNQAGGAIMEDFDNDGLLDLVVTDWDATQNMAFYHNKGDGTFEDRTKEAGLLGQLGGQNCVQTDYNNDGHMDIFICRGGWIPFPIRPSLLRNNGNGTFTDVTREAGLITPVNTIAATWADYDNDGFLDLFVCCEKQPNRLYHNKGDGSFEDVAVPAGVQGDGKTTKGAAWIDYDNDGFPDLFVNNLNGTAQLFHNNRNGTFTDVTLAMDITGPKEGFSCWAWDYDNDGWLDIFATCYDHTLEDVVKGLQGRPHYRNTCRLYRNLKGKGFQDVTKEVGLHGVYSTMGSNFGDFDNDGYLDLYLATGDPNLAMVIPNRMFKNVEGKRFVEITASSGTGHLQKGHGVACGDWDRDGNIDLFIQMGGAVKGDRYHNLLFQNPGQGNNWLTLKLIGKKTNRAAIGARIKAVTSGAKPLTIHRHVSSGSSYGASPLQQTFGLAKADRVALLEIHWPTSGTTQVFRDIAVNQAIEVTEFAGDYRKLNWKQIPVPVEKS